MVNGIPITAVGISNLPLEGGLPMAQARRIEVIRGPGSAVHGVDAFGGVINIITKDAADLPGTHAGASYGSFDTFTSQVSQSGSSPARARRQLPALAGPAWPAHLGGPASATLRKGCSPLKAQELRHSSVRRSGDDRWPLVPISCRELLIPFTEQ